MANNKIDVPDDLLPPKPVKIDVPDDLLPPKETQSSVFEMIPHMVTAGGTKGWLDEAAGAIKARQMLSAERDRSTAESEARRWADETGKATTDTARAMERRFLNEWPKLAPAMKAAGDIGSDLFVAALGGPSVARAYLSMPGQALVGAFQGAGESESDDLAQVTADAAQNAGLRAVGAKVGGVIADSPVAKYFGTQALRGAKKVGEYLDVPAEALARFAERRAVKAAQPMLKDYRGMELKDKVQETGRDLLAQKVIPWLGGLKTIANRSQSVADKQGQKIGGLLGRLDDEAAHVPTTEGPFPDAPTVAERIRTELAGKMKGNPALDPYTAPLEHRAKLFADMPEGQMTFAEANKLKGDFDDLVNHDVVQAVPKEMLKDVRRILHGEMQRAANTVNPEVAAQLTEANRLYGNMRRVSDFSGDHLARDQANRFVSPSDQAMGLATSLGTGNPITGMAVTAGHRLLRERGSGTVARTADAAARLWAATLPRLLKEAPEALGQFAKPLAASGGGEAMIATDFAMTKQFPAYARLKEQFLNSAYAEEP